MWIKDVPQLLKNTPCTETFTTYLEARKKNGKNNAGNGFIQNSFESKESSEEEEPSEDASYSLSYYNGDSWIEE